MISTAPQAAASVAYFTFYDRAATLHFHAGINSRLDFLAILTARAEKKYLKVIIHLVLNIYIRNLVARCIK